MGRGAVLVGLLALLVYLAFGSCLGHGLTNWDDNDNFLENRQIDRFGADDLTWAWTTPHLGVFQPLAWTFLGLQWDLGNHDPRVLHLVSLIVHFANCLLLWKLAAALLVRANPSAGRSHLWAAWLSAALFAVHPLRTEVVAWASCQPYLPSVLFFLLATLAYVRAHGSEAATSGQRRARIVVFLCFVVAVLFKAVSVTLPAFLLVLDFYPLRRLGGDRGWFGRAARPVWIEKLPYFLVVAAATVTSGWAKNQAGAIVPIEDDGWLSRAVGPAHSAWFYLAKTVFPWPLHVYHFAKGPMPAAQARFFVPLLVTPVAIAALAVVRKRAPWLAAAAAAYLILLGPNIGLLRAGEVIVSDRYSYLASVPLVLTAAGVLHRLCGALHLRRLVAGLGLAALVAAIPLSRRQTATWSDSVSLWRHALAHGAADSGGAHNNLGSALTALGRKDEAFAEYTEAVRLSPQFAAVNANLGQSLAERGRTSEALVYLERAVQIDPRNVLSLYNLGVISLHAGHADAARARFESVVRLRSDHASALTNLAVIELNAGRDAQGKALLMRALGADPRHAIAHFNLGMRLQAEGDGGGAATHYREALKIDPGLHEAKKRLQEAGAAP